MNAIFVYGTLKRGHLRSSMWPASPISIHEALIRASLFDLGAYPGIAPGNDWVLGELWRIAPADWQETLRVLDSVEGYDAQSNSGLYLRTEVEAHAVIDEVAESASSPETAFAYWINDPGILASARRIQPTYSFREKTVARWPDALSRVPARLEDE